MDDVTPMHKMETDNGHPDPARHPERSEGSHHEIPTKKLVGIFIGLILLGTVSGFVISKVQSVVRMRSLSSDTAEKEAPKEVAGIKDKETFKDSATGILKPGGFEGEGSHHLERPGGKSQNVYVTSSTVDLDEYTDHKVTVWGQTFAAEKAGWLMDVGLVEVLD